MSQTLLLYCNAPYHESCASKTAPLNNGALTKCCGPLVRSPTMLDSPLSAISNLSEHLGNMNKSITELKNQFSNITSNLREVTSDLNVVKLRVGNTDVRVDEFSKKINDMEGIISAVSNYTNTVVDQFIFVNKHIEEFENRINRKNNLILFDFPEPTSVNPIEEDRRKFFKFIFYHI